MRRPIVLATAICLVVTAGAAMADNVFPGFTEYVDPDGGNQRNGMHACPDGFAMGGDHLNDNRILCRRLPTLGRLDAPYVETGNEDHGMLACQGGYYAIGLHGQNTLLCQKASDISLGERVVDTGSQNYGMHICPQQSGGPEMLMVGMLESNNWRLCAPVKGWTLP